MKSRREEEGKQVRQRGRCKESEERGGNMKERDGRVGIEERDATKCQKKGKM